jgi:hypothetical protein
VIDSVINAILVNLNVKKISRSSFPYSVWEWVLEGSAFNNSRGRASIMHSQSKTENEENLSCLLPN